MRWGAIAAFGVLVSSPLSAITVHAQTKGRPNVVVDVAGKKSLLKHSPSSVTGASTVLTHRDLSHAGDGAADVLRQVPGVQVTRAGATTDPSTASIRGADAKQVPVYLAGVRLNDEVNGAADLSTIPVWMLRSAEVFRGNAPAFQTDLGLGGAIYFEPLQPNETSLGAEAHVGSFGRAGMSLGARVGNGNSAALVSVRTSTIDNNYPFRNDHGLRYSMQPTEDRRVNADASDFDAWSIGSHTMGRVRISTVVHGFDREQGTSGIAITPARSARSHLRRLLSAVSATYSCPTTWSCLVLAQASLLVGQETLTDPNHELRTLRAEWQHSRGDRASASARAELGVTERLKLIPLLTTAFDTLEVTSPEAFPRQSSRATSALGIEAVWSLVPGLTAVGMTRGACYQTEAVYERLSRQQSTHVSHCPAAPDARVGLDIAPFEKLHLLANAGRVWREPTLGERYGVSAALMGEPDLRPEQTFAVDVGTRGEGSVGQVTVSWDAFVFRRSSQDLVRYRRTSLYAFAPYNVGKTVISGAELAFATTLPAGLSTHSTLTLLDPRDTTPGPRGPNDILPMTSRLTTNHELRWTYDPPSQAWQSAVSVRYYHRSSRYADAAGLIVLPAVQSIDASLSLKLNNPRFGISASFNNILDQQTLDYLGLPVPGRSFHTTLNGWW